MIIGSCHDHPNTMALYMEKTHLLDPRPHWIHEKIGPLSNKNEFQQHLHLQLINFDKNKKHVSNWQKTAAASIPRQSSQPWRKGLWGSMARISPTYRWGNRPQRVLYRQVCFHNGRSRPTILVGSWSQRRNTCRSFFGMKPSKGGQWVAMHIYICIYIYVYIYTYSLAMWQSHPIFLCFTSFGVQLVGRFGEGTLSGQKTLKPDWTSRFQKSSISPKNPKKTSLKKQTSLHNYIYTIPRHLWMFFPSTWGISMALCGPTSW